MCACTFGVFVCVWKNGGVCMLRKMLAAQQEKKPRREVVVEPWGGELWVQYDESPADVTRSTVWRVYAVGSTWATTWCPRLAVSNSSAGHELVRCCTPPSDGKWKTWFCVSNKIHTGRSAKEQEYATPDLFTAGHWHSEIPSIVTFHVTCRNLIRTLLCRPITYDMILLSPSYF